MCGCECTDIDRGYKMASKRWYAMRKSLKERGKWTGDRGPPHIVPEQEEGEPDPKQSRTDDGDSPETDPDMPELEPEITPEGKNAYFLFQMSAFGNGFTLLLWANPSSPAFEGLQGEAYERQEKTFLEDATCLLGCRWGIEFSYTTVSGVLYAFGTCSRFTISAGTLGRALGSLAPHISFNRGSVAETHERLIQYKICKERWNVPEIVTEGSYGESQQELQSGPSWRKRK